MEANGRMVAPEPVCVPITADELVNIYLHVREMSKKYENQNDVWKRGCATPRKFAAPFLSGITIAGREQGHFAGKVGELAIYKFFASMGRDCEYPDFSVRKFGDGGIDIKSEGDAFQLKTRFKDDGYTKKSSLVRQTNQNGITIGLTAEMHIFCQWDTGYSAEILGWASNYKISRMPIKQTATGGIWMNYVVHDSYLEDARSLVSGVWV